MQDLWAVGTFFLQERRSRSASGAQGTLRTARRAPARPSPRRAILDTRLHPRLISCAFCTLCFIIMGDDPPANAGSVPPEPA